MFRYDEGILFRQLEHLPGTRRAVFAAACAERLFPAYVLFEKQSGRGNSKDLSVILERLWGDLQGNSMTSRDMDASIERCMSLIPREDEGPWIEQQAAAEDAGAALAYALRCRKTGESQEAAWAARCCYEALDHFVVNRDDIDVNEAGATEAVVADPLVQAELARQQRDLDDLRVDEGLEDVVARLRLRAIAEASLVFDLRS
jgi:uncharacterized protein YjaG (DUF416 family)